MSAEAVAKLTEAISELQQQVGVKNTRKLLLGLAEGLGAPESSAPEAIEAPPEPGRPREQNDRPVPAAKLAHDGGQ